MKLIKLNTDYYVVVNDSEIKEGDCVLSKLNEIVVFGSNYTSSLYKKITHSTQPFNCNCSNKGYRLDTNCAERNHCFDKIQYLSLQEVKELIGEANMDITDIAFKAYQKQDTWTWTQFQYIFPLGYNQALEDNKEKKYTEEDMKTAFSRYAFVSTNNQPYNEDELLTEFYEFIQSLQPKTEWEVEIIDGKLKLKQ